MLDNAMSHFSDWGQLDTIAGWLVIDARAGEIVPPNLCIMHAWSGSKLIDHTAVAEDGFNYLNR